MGGHQSKDIKRIQYLHDDDEVRWKGSNLKHIVSIVRKSKGWNPFSKVILHKRLELPIYYAVTCSASEQVVDHILDLMKPHGFNEHYGRNVKDGMITDLHNASHKNWACTTIEHIKELLNVPTNKDALVTMDKQTKMLPLSFAIHYNAKKQVQKFILDEMRARHELSGVFLNGLQDGMVHTVYSFDKRAWQKTSKAYLIELLRMEENTLNQTPYLLTRKRLLEERDCIGNLPIYYAIAYDAKLEVVKYMYECNRVGSLKWLNCVEPYRRQNVLHTAARMNRVHCVSFLLYMGEGTESAKDLFQKTALDHAMEGSFEHCIQLLKHPQKTREEYMLANGIPLNNESRKRTESFCPRYLFRADSSRTVANEPKSKRLTINV
jgi:hypothetical protein